MHLRSVLRHLVLACGLVAPLGQAQTPADTWSGLVGRGPCEWLDAAALAPVVGAGISGQARTTQADTSCIWRTAGGRPLLTASVVAWPSPAALVLERDTMLQQIVQYGGNRFERLPSPGGVATIVIRNDRGRVTLFPNGSTQRQAITVNPHVVLNESAPQKAQRRERARAFVKALVARHGL